MEFKIRSGERYDMSFVLKLINELAVFEKEPNAVKITVDDLIENGFNDNPAFFTFVAELEGVIVGMALFYNRFSTWEGPSLHLEDLIVTEKFRGNGRIVSRDPYRISNTTWVFWSRDDRRDISGVKSAQK